MRCDYCYYLDKERLYRDTESTTPATMMPEEYLERYIRQYIEAQPEGIPVTFTWHGGEALLRPLSFYQRAIQLQEKYGKGRLIENTLQTNGLLLSQAWCQFFREHEWLIGISLDGTKEMHDRYRRTVSGLPTFERVMRGVKLRTGQRCRVQHPRYCQSLQCGGTSSLLPLPQEYWQPLHPVCTHRRASTHRG